MADSSGPRRPRPGADDLGAERPAPGVGDLADPRDFLALLDAMRKSKRLSYRQISRRAGKGMSSSTAQAMVAGDALPPLAKLHLFLAGCNVPPEERRRWITTWHRIGQSTSEAAGTTPDDPPAPAPRAMVPEVVPARLSPAPPVPRSPDPEPVAAHPRRRYDLARVRFALLALTAFTVGIGVLTASAILMWRNGVPVEIMFAVYGLLAVSVTSWMLVAQRYVPDRAPTQSGLVQEDPRVFLDPMPQAAKPVIGE
ncbi:helix-turn-helix transcriptional regulator [Actinosynnema sp. NPDC050436]|uniref:helix-turn-helix domain-containing protein n=1 Tax=Actinosynnema sp. NPDC050436 TaxID=3155659 RepID=UPI0033F47989